MQVMKWLEIEYNSITMALLKIPNFPNVL